MRKNLIKIIISLLAIAASVAWFYYSQYRAPKINVALYRHIGRLMADETVNLIGRKSGKIVVITLASHDYEELDVEYDAFQKRLKELGEFSLSEDAVDTEGKPKYGLGTGLSGRHFVRLVKKKAYADVIVSFIGAPKLEDAELADLTKMPKFVVQARAPEHLFTLFEKKLVQVAVVSRFTFPAPGPIKPGTTEEWFNKRFQVFRSDNAAAIPKDDKAE